MKKFVSAISVIMVIMFLAGSAYAGSLWGMVKNSGLEKRETKAIAIQVKGVDIRGYIFDVPEMQSVCINVWGDGVQQLECKTYKEMGIEELKKSEKSGKKVLTK